MSRFDLSTFSISGLVRRAGRGASRALVLASASAALLSLSVAPAHAERVRDLATVQGVRDNPLIGYGLVVGLDGTGDQTMQTPFTTQSLSSMLTQLGVTVPAGTNMQLRNVAAVMVTAALPSFARPGQAIDITVSSMGTAKSLRGGTLIMTPLKGADGQVYAVAQGNMLVGGAGGGANGSSVQINQLAVGKISGGAIVERGVPTMLASDGTMRMELNDTNFENVMKVVNAVNGRFGANTAYPLDGRTIGLHAPMDSSQQVAFIAGIQDLEITPNAGIAKIVLNARTGSIVMNRLVTLQSCAVTHGNLSVVINTTPAVSQPNAFGQGSTVTTQQSNVQVKQEGGALRIVGAGANLADVVRGLNALGATPADLMSILQAMKAAGALNADLEII
jgi:flagellar P-ring protein FlgI